MHSRKKTGVKDEAKEKAKLLKAQKFHSELLNLFDKKHQLCKDVDLLEPIAKLLVINPEFNTLFNYRREILLEFKKSLNDIENDEEKDEMKKKFHNLCRNELHFIENCLKSSPKSYATWHHRQWLIEQMFEPDLQNEIELCNKCLSLDERNFHCWDYRRFIVKFGNISTIDEFNFTTKKIQDNFSNFSSWHYRNSLYRQLLAENFDLEKLISMVDKDFDVVKNAIFTDPNDQSPWLFLHWLLEFEQQLLLLINHENANDEKQCSHIKRFICKTNLLAIEFDRKYLNFPIDKILINNNDTLIDCKMFKSKFDSTIWILQPIDLQSVTDNDLIEFEFIFKDKSILKQKFDKSDIYLYENEFLKKQNRLKQKRIEDLKILLEIESESKWPTYMLNIVLNYNDNDDNKEINKDHLDNQTIDRLIRIDPLRCNYYKDLKKMIISKRNLFSKNKSVQIH